MTWSATNIFTYTHEIQMYENKGERNDKGANIYYECMFEWMNE